MDDNVLVILTTATEPGRMRMGIVIQNKRRDAAESFFKRCQAVYHSRAMEMWCLAFLVIHPFFVLKTGKILSGINRSAVLI